MAISVGSKAPDFNLVNTDNQNITLQDFAGKPLVINFFPAAFTGVCTEQLCSNSDDLNFFNNAGAAVIGVSVDLPFSLKVFKDEKKINFDLLSDFNKEVIKAYGFYLEDFVFGLKGVSKRGVVVIDKEGKVVYSEETENPGVQVNFEKLKQAIQSLA